MKKLIYLFTAMACVLFTACMGDDYAEAQYEQTPIGNNAITDDNVISIQQLKSLYAKEISTDYRNGKSYSQVTEPLKIKGIVTSSDAQGNIYNELCVQDTTGGIIIAIAQGGLSGLLPVGTEIRVDLKDLYVGNYGLQAEIGVPTTNANNATYVGRMSRATWDKHYKVVSTGNNVEPELFADGNSKTTWDIAKDGGKLGVLRNVSFKFNSIDSTFADANGGAGSKSWYLKEQGRNVIVYNSNYADFANAKVPTGTVDITGIIKRYNNTWEIILRSLNDIQKPQAIFQEKFEDKTGSFTAYDVALDEALSYVWSGSSYGAKASAYVGGANHAAESWLLSPEIDLSKASAAMLSVVQCANYLGSSFSDNCKILLSTDYTSGDPTKATWTEINLDALPDADSKWTMITGNASLSSYAGKKVRLAFKYTSSETAAPTWEIRSVTIK